MNENEETPEISFKVTLDVVGVMEKMGRISFRQTKKVKDPCKDDDGFVDADKKSINLIFSRSSQADTLPIYWLSGAP